MRARYAFVRTALLAAVVLLPAPAQVPESADVFGFRPGTDFELADQDQMVGCFDALDAASDRVIVERSGTTTLGRPMILVLISSEANLRDLGEDKRLADELRVTATPTFFYQFGMQRGYLDDDRLSELLNAATPDRMP